ncbi:MAG TPA: DUF5682 family protein [Blastocatellia bacterium]|nr:DUF5682 family protein [Blastocatellia bacterium]
MSLHIFGIRHHGPGSARSLREALESLRPDAILVEGPPDAADVLPLLAHAEMKPPVALLIYAPDEPQRAVFYPFAVFSPEWQAIQYALHNSVTVRLMDLPVAHQFAAAEDESAICNLRSEIQTDPLGQLATAAGYGDGESWWSHVVEERRSSDGVFAAIAEAMTTLRETAAVNDSRREAQREAWMRQTIRAAQREGYERIAVVCGAWHAPAIDVTRQSAPSAKDDAALLKNLPKVKVSATWIPWTNGRLSYASGYGAGIAAPGWYQHLWEQPDRTTIHWLTRVARLLRDEDLDASPASIIEAARLAETLAALRERTAPGLAELTEATQTVLCFGQDAPLRLVHDKLIVGETLGAVPEATPAVPLQQDVQREQKRLRLQAEATHRDLDLDLRKENDLERSHLLHRLSLLGIAWGQLQQGGNGKGTFHELWRLQWQPEFSVALIEAGRWGNTLREAATAFACHTADAATELPALTALLDHALLADLPAAVKHLMNRLHEQAAVASDTAHLMQALPPLARVMRYGNVRQTDVSMVAEVVAGLVARICIGLPGACASLSDEAAAVMFDHLVSVSSAIALLQNDEHQSAWRAVLKQMADQQGLHGLIAGRCCRMLLDAAAFDGAETAQRLSLALSTANEPAQAAAWLEGLLKGSGLILLHDDALWQTLDEWVTGLDGEAFTQLLPLLRRTFSTFAAPERRQMGERVRSGPMKTTATTAGRIDFDATRAEAVLPLVRQLLGLH